MKIALLVLAVLWPISLFADRHSAAERDHHPESAKLATGDINQWRNSSRTRYEWPVQLLSIGHTTASYQNYNRGNSRAAYFHHGLDIRADAGTEVFASAGGKVVNIENYMPGDPAYWEIAILDDDGFLWQYHHLNRNSIPSAVQEAFKSGAKIATGAKLGEVYYWPLSSFGERYHHIHLNVLGKNKEYLSPFSFLKPLGDTRPPEITRIQIAKNGKVIAGTTVSGPYTLHAEMSDLVLHDKFLVPPHAVSVEIDGQMPWVVWEFETLPGGSSNTAFVNQLWVSPTCGNYTCRRHVMDLGFSTGNPRLQFPSTPGAHRAIVRVRDYQGNLAEKAFEWTVQ